MSQPSLHRPWRLVKQTPLKSYTTSMSSTEPPQFSFEIFDRMDLSDQVTAIVATKDSPEPYEISYFMAGNKIIVSEVVSLRIKTLTASVLVVVAEIDFSIDDMSLKGDMMELEYRA